MKLYLKLHLTFIYAFIPRFYSLDCLSKLRNGAICLFGAIYWILQCKTGHFVIISLNLSMKNVAVFQSYLLFSLSNSGRDGMRRKKKAAFTEDKTHLP